jgi:DNA repair ATPase RecN
MPNGTRSGLEVARMLSGAKVTDTSLQHAGQMIAASR